MSVQATTWVWSHSQAEGTARLVLLAIADAANREGENSCQAVPTIAEMCRVHEATVYRKVSELVGIGELEKSGRDTRYGTTIYSLPKMRNPSQSATPSPSQGCDPSQSATPRNSDITPSQNGHAPLAPLRDNPINPNRAKALYPINSAPQQKPAGERKPPMRNPTYSHLFEQFWEAYPRQEDKLAAYEMWKSATKFTEASTIIKAARAYKDRPNRDPKFTKLPSNWLKNRGWEDGAPEPQRAPQAAQKIPGWVARDQANQQFAHAYLNQQQPAGGPAPLDSNWIAGELA